MEITRKIAIVTGAGGVARGARLRVDWRMTAPPLCSPT